jgi:hypothetical protein
MVKESLVGEAIASGQKLVEFLRTTDFRLEAAFWFWMEERGVWRLVLATPLVHEGGRLVAYDRLRALTESRNWPDKLMDQIDLVSPSEGIITIFDFVDNRLPQNRLIQDESVTGVWIEGAYIYFFEPRTFMTEDDAG